MEITRRATGHRPDFLCKTAGIAIRGACTTGQTNICRANASLAFVVLYLLAQFIAGSMPDI